MALSISPAARRQLTNGLTAFSLGTLCFIRRWYDLEHLQPRGLDYFRSAPENLALSGIHDSGGGAARGRVLGRLVMGGAKFHPRLRLFAQCRVRAGADLSDRIGAAVLEYADGPVRPRAATFFVADRGDSGGGRGGLAVWKPADSRYPRGA